MGLDMTLYSGQNPPIIDETNPCCIAPPCKKTVLTEIQYWRKFNALHDFFEKKFDEVSLTSDFNCTYFIVTEETLESLRQACIDKTLKPVEGFFFGNQNPVEDSDYSELLELVDHCLSLEDVTFVYHPWW